MCVRVCMCVNRIKSPDVCKDTSDYLLMLFWAAGRRPYIVFTFTGSVRNVRNDVNLYIYIYIYIYIYVCIYIHMSTTWRTRSRYKIFRLYFGEIHSFAPDFISEGSFRPEEFFEILF